MQQNGYIRKRKREKKKGMLQRAMEQMVEECVSYASQSGNQEKLHTAILAPTVSYIFQQFSPYLVAFMCIFILNFILTIVLLVFVLRLRV
jgi:hypothetical protein